MAEDDSTTHPESIRAIDAPPIEWESAAGGLARAGLLPAVHDAAHGVGVGRGRVPELTARRERWGRRHCPPRMLRMWAGRYAMSAAMTGRA